MGENGEKKPLSLAERARRATESADDLFAAAKDIWAGALDDSADPNQALIYALRGHALELSACTCILAAAFYGVAHHYGMDAKPEDLFDAILGPTRKAAESAKES